MDCFSNAVAFIRRFEGSSVNDPDDPGGVTNHGITHKTLSRYRGYHVSKGEVEELSWSEACEIYKTQYWHASRCNEMPDPVAFVVFDVSVNQGTHNASVFLQRSLNRLGANVSVDGITGRQTLDALSTTNSENVVEWISAYRSRHYSVLPHIFKYGLGWFRRVAAATWHAAKQ